MHGLDALFQPVDQVRAVFLDAVSAALRDDILTTLALFATLTFIYYAARILFYSSRVTLGDLAAWTIKFLIVYSIIASSDWMATLIYDPVVDLPFWIGREMSLGLGNQLSGNLAIPPEAKSYVGSPYQFFNAMLNAIYTAVEEYEKAETSDDWGLPDFMTGLRLILIYIVVAFMTAVAFIMIGMAKIGSVALLVLSPIYVMLFFFESTKQYTMAWISALVYFMVLQLLTMVYLMFGGLIGFESAQKLVVASQSSAVNGFPLDIYWEMVIILLAICYALTFIPSQAAMLASSGGLMGFNPAAMMNRQLISTINNSVNKVARYGGGHAKEYGKNRFNEARDYFRGGRDPSSARRSAESEANRPREKAKAALRGFK